MVRSLWVTRVLGVASTTHGFAYVVVENSNRLVEWGFRNVRSEAGFTTSLAAIAAKARPAFAACDTDRLAHRNVRGSRLQEALARVCRDCGAFPVAASRSILRGPEITKGVPNRVVVEAVAKRFPVLARKLPRKRRIWDGADDRVGVFIAAFAAAAALDGLEANQSEAGR